MQRSKRQKLIIESVSSGPRTIQTLAELTGASAVSIRRDLAELATQGALRRIRGGAAPVAPRGVDFPFALRHSSDIELKRKLASRVVDFISPGESLFLDNGTTALAVAESLAGTGVTAMAASLHSAAALASVPGNQVIVPGGPVDHDDLSFSGSGAAEAVAAMRFDTSVIGACAADPESGLTVAGWGDAQVKKAAITASRRVILVATSEKFSRTAAHHFAAFDEVDVIVTPAPAPSAVRAMAMNEGIDLVEVN